MLKRTKILGTAERIQDDLRIITSLGTIRWSEQKAGRQTLTAENFHSTEQCHQRVTAPPDNALLHEVSADTYKRFPRNAVILDLHVIAPLVLSANFSLKRSASYAV